MHYYLTTWRGQGTELDPFVPFTSGVAWTDVIDLRPDPTVVAGRCFLASPARLPVAAGRRYLGDNPDDMSLAARTAVSEVLGLDLASLPAAPLRRLILRVLADHGDDADPGRWNRLQPVRRIVAGRRALVREVWLGGEQLDTELAAIDGPGSTLAESFNKGDSTTLGPDLTWTELANDFDIVGNAARTVAISATSVARADSPLASGDHWAEVVISAISGTTGLTQNLIGSFVRQDNTATVTHYSGRARSTTTIGYDIQKVVAGAVTSLGTVNEALPATPFTLRTTANGSTIAVSAGGVSKVSLTDTAIAGSGRPYVGIRAYRDLSSVDAFIDSFAAADIPSSVAGTQAAETDTANAGTANVRPAGVQAAETDTANGGAPRLLVAGSQAAETDTAFAGAVSVRPAGSLAAETDTANGGVPSVRLAGTQAAEADTANGGTPSSGGDIVGSKAEETDTALAGAALVAAAGTQATEADSALGGTPSVTAPGTQAAETDTATTGAPSILLAGATADEIDTAFAGMVAVHLAGTQAAETDTARAGTATIAGSARDIVVIPGPPRTTWRASRPHTDWAASGPRRNP